MDVSSIFISCVRNVYSGCQMDASSANLSIIPAVQCYRNKRTSFDIKIQIIMNQMKKLYLFLQEHRNSYINLYEYLSSTAKFIDFHKNEFEFFAESIISTCLNLIKLLKEEIQSSEMLSQNEQHRKIVIYMTENHLKNVCKVYFEYKAIRVKKNLELKQISKLEYSFKNVESYPNYKCQLKNTIYLNKINPVKTATPLRSQENNKDMELILQSEDEFQFSEDIQLFEAENEQLYNELSALTEEIGHIESKVVQISELQEIFTEKVLYQDRNLERILTLVVGSTENVIQANEHIRIAIQRNAGFRVWFLFFLLVMSFTLIFLDWYNP